MVYLWCLKLIFIFVQIIAVIWNFLKFDKYLSQSLSIWWWIYFLVYKLSARIVIAEIGWSKLHFKKSTKRRLSFTTFTTICINLLLRVWPVWWKTILNAKNSMLKNSLISAKTVNQSLSLSLLLYAWPKPGDASRQKFHERFHLMCFKLQSASL